MSVGNSAEWWRDRSHEFGPYVMDCSLKVSSDWQEIVANGREELDRILMRTNLPTGKDLALLEIGCGLGRLTSNLADQFGFVVGVDISPALIQQARERTRHTHVAYETTDGQGVSPAARDRFDVVFSNEVFHYIDRPMLQRYFHDTFRLLVPGGSFVFECNCRPIPLPAQLSKLIRRALHLCGRNSWRGWPTDSGFHRKPHTVALITSMLANSGFKLERVLDDRLNETWFFARKPSLGSDTCR